MSYITLKTIANTQWSRPIAIAALVTKDSPSGELMVIDRFMGYVGFRGMKDSESRELAEYYLKKESATTRSHAAMEDEFLSFFARHAPDSALVTYRGFPRETGLVKTLSVNGYTAILKDSIMWDVHNMLHMVARDQSPIDYLMAVDGLKGLTTHARECGLAENNLNYLNLATIHCFHKLTQTK